MSSTFVRNIYKHFEVLSDPRVQRCTNHRLGDLLFITLCAFICDADSWVDVERFAQTKERWLRKYVPLTNGIPSHDTLGRVFAMLDGEDFQKCLMAFASELITSLKGKTVAVDGKSVRGSYDHAVGQSCLHNVSAWVSDLKVCLGMTSVADKSNEIPAVQELIASLELKGAVVTADAMHCQKKTCQAILDKKADYILAVKKNQSSLMRAIAELGVAVSDKPELAQNSHTPEGVERGHARHETRSAWSFAVPADHAVFKQWPGLQSVVQVTRIRKSGDKETQKVQSYISSLPADAENLSQRVREHWGIENSQHYVLDVTFTEDASRIRKANAPEISSTLRRFALNILQSDKTLKESIRGKRKMCGWDDFTFSRLLANA